MGGLVEKFKRPQHDWHRYFMDLAERTALMSKDPDRKVGAVLVSPDRRQLSVGYNGLPADVPDSPGILGSRDLKLNLIVHAEPNCLRQAPFNPRGCTLYVTRFPCLACAEDWILPSGVAEVVAPAPDLTHPRWGTSWNNARACLLGNGIKVTHMDN